MREPLSLIPACSGDRIRNARRVMLERAAVPLCRSAAGTSYCRRETRLCGSLAPSPAPWPSASRTFWFRSARHGPVFSCSVAPSFAWAACWACLARADRGAGPSLRSYSSRLRSGCGGFSLGRPPTTGTWRKSSNSPRSTPDGMEFSQWRRCLVPFWVESPPPPADGDRPLPHCGLR